jgi:hypothetical protein
MKTMGVKRCFASTARKRFTRLRRDAQAGLLRRGWFEGATP